jgi:AAA+ ATPase superfamily predicted ATPase
VVGLVNRENEQARLSELWARPGPALALIYGRRRVGKTYFLQHAREGRRGVYFLAAESSSLENLEELLAQARHSFPERPDIIRENYPSWRVALRLLCELAAMERLLVVFDEFSYLVGVDPSLPSILQAVWDQDARSSQLKLILCGSEIGLLGALDDYGRPLHGRFDWAHTYRPLAYYDAARFFLVGSPPIQAYGRRDVLLLYGVLGGSGRYLAAVDPARSIGENIARLVLDPQGIFHREGENLIRQERDIRDYANYNAVLEAIAGGATEWGEIANQAHLERHVVGGTLDRLRELGWVAHEKPFEEPGRRGIYRLDDNFLKFWYRFVFHLRSALQTFPPVDAWTELVEPHLSDYMGRYVFEGICAQHLRRFGRGYGLPMLLDLGRWWSRPSDIEIDLIGKLADGSYLVGECKWSRQPCDVDVLSALQHKLASTPHGRWRAAPHFMLFSAAGFTPRLVERARAEGAILVGPEEFGAGP